MVNTTIGVGAFLTLLGIGGYLGTGGASVTALIPTFFGVPILALGFVGRREGWRKNAMHIAVALGLLGFLGSAPRLFQSLAGGAEFSAAIAMLSLMALVCAVYVGLGVRSFIVARRGRQKSAA